MASTQAATPTASSTAAQKANSRRLDKSEKNVLVHLLQAPKLTNGDIAKIIDVDERTISRRRKQLRTLGHLSPERNVKGAEKLRPWHLEVEFPSAAVAAAVAALLAPLPRPRGPPDCCARIMLTPRCCT